MDSSHNQAKPKLTAHERWKAINPDKPLTGKESAFVAEYLKDMNATQALKRLGRTGKGVERRAVEIMARANVRYAIGKAIELRVESCNVSVERIGKAYAAIAFGSHDGPILASHKLGALDSLAKWKGMFKASDSAAAQTVVFQFLGAPQVIEKTDVPTIEHKSDQS